MAGELKKIPPDLTKYTERNGGVFPSERLRQIIDGRGIAAHGNREMPVWGDGFRSAKDGLTPEAAQARIDAVVRYLSAIQQRAAENEVDLSRTVNQDGTSTNPFHQPHYLLISLAIGGTQGGDPSKTEFPARFEVDYVRVYQSSPPR
jgi:hypothetical protein